MIGLDYNLAVDHDDATQRRWALQKVYERDERQRELWRWLLSQKMGREWLTDVLLLALGPVHHLGGGSAEQLHGQVALHNLACAWLGEHIFAHRDLYLQMQAEALKREETDRKELDAMRVEWRRRRMAGAEDDGEQP